MRLYYITASAVLLGLIGCSGDIVTRAEAQTADQACADHNGWSRLEARTLTVIAYCADNVVVSLPTTTLKDTLHQVSEQHDDLDHQVTTFYCADDTIITMRMDVTHDGYPAKEYK